MSIELTSLIYLAAGIVSALFLSFVALRLAKEKADAVKARIFLHYSLFKTAFYILAAGTLFVAAGHLGEIINNTWLHDIGESLHDLSMVIFALIFYLMIKARVAIK